MDLDQILDPLARYKPADDDDAGATKYYGRLAINGEWYIMRWDTAAKTYRYARGAVNYLANWNDRVNLDYKLLNDAF